MEVKKKFYAPLVLFLVIYAALFCVVGWYSWPKPGDDFGAAMTVAQQGFWPAQVFMYTQWSGRIVNTFVWDFFVLFPMELVYRVLPLIMLLFNALCLWTFVGILPPPKLSQNTKLSLTAIATAATLAFSYSLNETFYWIAGSPYFWCTSLILLATAFAIKALQGSRAAFWACIITILLNGTVYEQPCIFQGILAFFAMIYFAAVKDRKRARICCIFWLAAITSFCIMFFAPGTAIRMKTYDTGSFFHRILNGLIVAGAHGFFTAMQFFVKPLIYVFLLFMPLIAKKFPAAKIKLKIWHIVIITASLAPLMQFLQSWSLGTALPERAVSLALWCMAFTWCLLFSFFYRGKLTDSEKFANFARRWRYVLFVLALLISANFIDGIKALKLGSAYRAENIVRVQSIEAQKATGIEDVIVPRLENRPPLIYEDLNISIDTGSFAEYYGVKSVLAIPKELLENPEAIRQIQNDDLTPLTKIKVSDPQIQYWLGYLSDPLYKNSHGLEMSLDAAEYWDRLAASNGHIRAMRALSRVLYTKDKSLRGILRAVYWLARSQIASLRL